MRYSYRIEQAVRAATVLHEGQYRKGPAPYPYVAHPVAVSLIVGDYTEDEDVVIAALLHDTLEDSDYTEEEIEEDFGPNVRELVVALTQPTPKDDSDEAWREAKEEYLKKLERAEEGSLIVAAADKLHNMRSVVEEYHGNVERFLKDFGGSLESRLVAYQKFSNIINRRLSNPIIHEFNHVFDEYKKFIQHAKEERA